MKRICLLAAICFLSTTLIAPAAGVAEETKRIELPKPQIEGGKRLMEALKDRKSSRNFRSDMLPPQVLSNLLWAAFGVNRPQSGGRTAPSAHGWNEIDVYIATADGLYVFDAKSHSLNSVHSDDVRAKTGLQSFAAEAPIDLIYVADLSKMGGASEEDKNFYSAADTGFVSQNVYLFASSEGLATVVRGSIDRRTLAQAMRLRPEQKIILAQTIGYPK